MATNLLSKTSVPHHNMGAVPDHELGNTGLTPINADIRIDDIDACIDKIAVLCFKHYADETTLKLKTIELLKTSLSAKVTSRRQALFYLSQRIQDVFLLDSALPSLWAAWVLQLLAWMSDPDFASLAHQCYLAAARAMPGTPEQFVPPAQLDLPAPTFAGVPAPVVAHNQEKILPGRQPSKQRLPSPPPAPPSTRYEPEPDLDIISSMQTQILALQQQMDKSSSKSADYISKHTSSYPLDMVEDARSRPPRVHSFDFGSPPQLTHFVPEELVFGDEISERVIREVRHRSEVIRSHTLDAFNPDHSREHKAATVDFVRFMLAQKSTMAPPVFLYYIYSKTGSELQAAIRAFLCLPEVVACIPRTKANWLMSTLIDFFSLERYQAAARAAYKSYSPPPDADLCIWFHGKVAKYKSTVFTDPSDYAAVISDFERDVTHPEIIKELNAIPVASRRHKDEYLAKLQEIDVKCRINDYSVYAVSGHKRQRSARSVTGPDSADEYQQEEPVLGLPQHSCPGIDACTECKSHERNSSHFGGPVGCCLRCRIGKHDPKLCQRAIWQPTSRCRVCSTFFYLKGGCDSNKCSKFPQTATLQCRRCLEFGHVAAACANVTPHPDVRRKAVANPYLSRQLQHPQNQPVS